ncbi:type III secretion protein [Pseudomonas sp. FP2196]|uniref:Type III secretion protein n=1 Tax=Pseudomonas frederiksbergensis TaxID=104087 RepID=A0A423HMP5_9PSED|nr:MULTISPECIES: type III secretion protein [Pseudomonas]RON14443.1 type III secretion protein [Pseudomonas frederiksbergensis]TPG88496.1 type III secretion protein [Pseudomonas caspiana]WLH36479.1 type III secretion protein [Pseudomonas sp. FP2196]
MISFKALQHRLDNSFSNSQTKTDEAALDAADSGSPEDMMAFSDAAQKMATATSVLSEGLRAQHGLTKAIIDGIQ